MRRELPGIRFDVVAAPADRVLPRMDVAGFVGLAASGPVDHPTPVESPEQLETIFGGEVETPVGPGFLAASVRAFFAQGGTRCFVVRLGTGARTTPFVLPGVVWWDGTTVHPAALTARSPGLAADDWRVATALAATSRPIVHLDVTARGVSGLLASRAVLTPGDLVRLRNGSDILLFAVLEVSTNPDGRRTFLGTRLARVTPATPLPEVLACRPVLRSPEGAAPQTDVERVKVDLRPLSLTSTGVNGPANAELVPGMLLQSRDPLTASPVYGVAREVRDTTEGRAASVRWHRVNPDDGSGLPSEPTARAALLSRAEVLTLDLLIYTDGPQPRVVSGLGFHPAHPRHWRRLPTDLEHHSGRAAPAGLANDLSDPRGLCAGTPWVDLAEVPLRPVDFDAGLVPIPPGFDLPLDIGVAGDLSSPALPEGDPLTRAGLTAWSPIDHLDPRLRDSTATTLVAAADEIRHLQPDLSPGDPELSARRRQLRGVHALLGLDDVTLVALPDLGLGGWSAPVPVPAPPPILLEDPPGPIFHVCAAPPYRAPAWPGFEACLPENTPGIGPVAPTAEGVDPRAWDPITRRLTWSPVSGPAALRYRVQVGVPSALIGSVSAEIGATRLDPARDFADAEDLGPLSTTSLTLPADLPLPALVRVRAEVGSSTPGAWSRALWIAAAPVPTVPHNTRFILDVQLALLRLCAARGDLFAVLSSRDPRQRSSGDADTLLQHSQLLRAGIPDGAEVLPLGFGERAALSHGALYGPWTSLTDGDRTRDLPPDGLVCGLIARRSRELGAWVAPASQRLREVVALCPALPSTRALDLQEARINEVWACPRGFEVRNALTLADDNTELEEINVRRLLHLLRRLALREGGEFVFEPHNTSFQRSVRITFERLLGELYARGAFAGADPASSFRVRAGPEVNPPTEVDRGRFVVELRVAPSHPLRFLTVRLVRTDARGLAAEGA